MFEPLKAEKPSTQIERPLRSESPVAKRAKLQPHKWVMNGKFIPLKLSNFLNLETINLHEYFAQKQERCWINWRDFVGRQTAPDKPAVLYPNLEQSERPEPQGGVRPNRGRPRR
jgi:hypothetical protein